MYFTKCTRGHLLLAAVIELSIIFAVSACRGKMVLHYSPVTEYDKQLILDVHNRYRESVALGQIRGQPPAAYMMELKWDEELATHAQKWASSCISTAHDEGRNIPRFLVGQNIATTWTNVKPSSFYDMQPDYVKAIGKWFDEVRHFAYGRIGYQSGHAGHYTQLVWADTTLVGCGFAFYFDPSKGFVKNYVCNYGPGGNVITQKPYQKGQPSCTLFGLEQSSKYPGLCDKPSRTLYDILSNFIG